MRGIQVFTYNVGSGIGMHKPLGMRAKAGCVHITGNAGYGTQCVDESFHSIHSTSLLYILLSYNSTTDHGSMLCITHCNTLLLQDSPVVPSNEPVQVFGYLQKQGRRLKGWHQRWFEIRGQHMYYYKTNAVSRNSIRAAGCMYLHLSCGLVYILQMEKLYNCVFY